jgi:hypothetical protein
MTPVLIGEERGTAEETYSRESKTNLLKLSSASSLLFSPFFWFNIFLAFKFHFFVLTLMQNDVYSREEHRG